MDKTTGRIHFGSLEAVEAARKAASAERAAAAAAAAAGSTGAESTSSPVVIAALPSKGTSLSDLKVDNNYEISDNSKRARDQHTELMEEFERKKRARNTAVPTDDKKVRAKLQELNEPQTLFGEDNMDRRARLRDIMSRTMAVEPTGDGDEEMKSEGESGSDDEEEEVYTPGTDSLLKARRFIAHYSLPRAAHRIERQKEENTISMVAWKSTRAEVFESLKSYANYSSQIGDERPLSQCSFSPDSNFLATGSFGGMCKIWSIPDSRHVHSLRGHTDKIGGIKWHPRAHISQDRGAVNLATGGGDGLVHLWSLESDTPIQSLKGHGARVARIGFHPTGRFLGSCGYEGAWRLWDIEAGAELLTQRGHSREVYSIAFQCDGSLVATGGLDAIGRIWDLRTGRSALTMEGHVDDILSMDFSPNGYQIATGSADNSIRIWDLRTLRSIHSIPAHTGMVNDLKFYVGQPVVDDEPGSKMIVEGEERKPSKAGLYLASCSQDATIKIWSADDWKLQKSLVGHTGKVMGLDISSNGRYIGSAGFDKTFKLWAPENADY